jgi:hypothetical protein
MIYVDVSMSLDWYGRWLCALAWNSTGDGGGHGGFAGLLLGPVSANVAEHVPYRVLVVHGQHGPPSRVAS